MKRIATFLFVLFFSAAFSQNPTYQQKLYYSCKLWGFVKYYHSEVSTCKVNWDSVLLANLPKIKNAVTKNDFNDVLDSMLLAAGPMAIDTTPFPDVLAPELKRNRDWTWWVNDTMIRSDVKIQLDTIRNNFRPHVVCWVKFNDYSNPNYFSYLVFPKDSLMLNVNTNVNYPDEWTRLLVLFKYWNIIKIFNPYNYVLDNSIDSILYNNALPFAVATNDSVFVTAIMQTAANLDDAHVEGHTGSALMEVPEDAIPSYLKIAYIPNKYLVVKSNIAGISKGDEILSVDGLTPIQIENKVRPYVSVGNISVFRRYVADYFLLGGKMWSTAIIVYKDSLGNNQTISKLRNTYGSSAWFSTWYPNDTLKNTKWAKWNCNVGYVNMGKLQPSDVNAMYGALQNTSAIIFDIRNYPNGTGWPIMDLLYPSRMSFAKYLVPDLTYPGTVFWANDSLGINNNPTPYNGQVIILMNEETQSQAEFTCMMLEAIPNTIKVGSQTTGADGNVSFFNLSQEIDAGFTSLGVFYPNGDSTQRIGIVPDTVVYPTQIGIRHGRDEVLEKALQIANCTGIKDIAEQHRSIKIYPNPSAGKFIIEASGELQAYNMLGEKIYSQQLVSEKSEIDLSSRSKGIYFLKVQSGDKIYSGKVIIQ